MSRFGAALNRAIYHIDNWDLEQARALVQSVITHMSNDSEMPAP
jgi:hypothetical protein